MKIFSRPVSLPAVPRWLTKLALAFVILAIVGGAISAGTALFVYRQLSKSYDLTQLGQMPSRSEVFDADGKFYGRLQSEQNRVLVSLKDISPRFIDAILTREDARFWEHGGVDFRGIARAAWRNVRNGGTREGASTITQQLARNTFALDGRTLHRKLLEAMVASRIEEKYSKDQILEFYLNRIYLGAGVYGVEAAAQKYFGKSSNQLTLGESAMLAGIVRNPNRNSPLRNLAGAEADRNSVLERMVALDKISAQDAAAAKAEPTRLALNRSAAAQDDYVMEAVRAELGDYISPDQIAQGGLHVYTTIDSHLQRFAADALEERLTKIEQTKKYGHLTREQYLARIAAGAKTDPDASPDYLQGALLAVDNRTGAIVAMVGGRNYEESHYNRALYAKRQAGSTFKPFVYAAAFEQGMTPDSLVDDSPLRPGEIKTVSSNWKPENSDRQFLGPQPAAFGLIQSRNVMSIRVGEWAGMNSVLSLAKRAGLGGVNALPSSYLGAFETTLKDLTGAYTMFPNHGQAREPYFIKRIDAADGRPLYQAPHETSKVASAATAQTTSDVLERVVSEGTAKQAASLGLRAPAAGKTGTTNDYKDAWFVGYTTSLTCGVWVGMDKPQPIAAKGYGAALALPLWVDFVQEAAGKSAERYPALALHGVPDATQNYVAVASTPTSGGSGFMYAGNKSPDADAAPVPALDNPDAATDNDGIPAPLYQPPTDPGSQFIKDPRTGRIIGIDGSAGAAAEESATRQPPRALPVSTAQVGVIGRPAAVQARPVYASQPAVAPVAAPTTALPTQNGPVSVQAVPVAAKPAYDSEMPVLRARPVDAAQRLSAPALDSLGNLSIPRAQPVMANVPRAKQVPHSRVYVLPDGPRLISRTQDANEE